MFSVIFPGQGSQIVGMAKEFYENYSYIRDIFSQSDEILKKNLSKIILEGPQSDLNQTENTQSAIFIVSYSIFKIIQNEKNFKLKKAKFYAGHSLGEYSALCCAESISFEQTLLLLKHRGKAMQTAFPNGKGGMIAILGSDIEFIKNLLIENYSKFKCYIANDNSVGQIVVSGETSPLELLGNVLKNNNIKFLKLPVSAPFHCPLMAKATSEMKSKILETDFRDPLVSVISNVTATPQNKFNEIQKLLIDQIEKPVRWRESIINMINFGVNEFIEIGPGRVLSGLIKRIDRNVKINHVNNLIDIKKIND